MAQLGGYSMYSKGFLLAFCPIKNGNRVRFRVEDVFVHR